MEQSDHVATPTPGEPHPAADASTPPANNQDALTAAEVVDNTGGIGSFGLGTQVWGQIGTMHHALRDGRTTVCDKQLDDNSTTQRLASPPQGLLCGTCLGRLVGA